MEVIIPKETKIFIAPELLKLNEVKERLDVKPSVSKITWTDQNGSEKSITTFIKTFCFENDERHRRIIEYLKKIAKDRHLSESQIVFEALEVHIDKQIRLLQSRLDTFRSPLEEALEKLHANFISTNAGRHPTFEACLKDSGLWTTDAITLSVSRGWLRSVVTR